ncbi:glycosyltransferase family 4 protein [Noviherbaspirillum sp.]|uniref:glycosyltransferase family 4 protein n=1 Tax=Noviherbaspirillum sp. TaxID=1926288 RepID=UPI002B46AFA1|nr:glycosyltransferase family 4 protein [Noviherbaspirillum sp.]HJV83654.1 glycosyltransferase family 4 protein [Noviherbaspirillum sp.]
MSATIKVLHVFKTYYPDSMGGVEAVIRQLTAATEPMGVSNRIFTLSWQGNASPVLREGTVEVLRAQTHLEIASTPISFNALHLFRDSAARADLVHYHYPWPFGDVLNLLGGHTKPAILTYHSDIVRQRMLMPAYRPLMRRFFANVDMIVPTSPNYLQSSEILQEYRDKATVIPIGMDENCYPEPTPERLRYWREQEGEGFFLFVGVLRYYKGLHILLDACANNNSRVVIVGAGPVEASLRQQATRLGLTNVRFVGAVPDEDKVALLKLCKAVVFPSHLRSEAFGVTLLEGAMYGKPLISSEIGTGSSYVNIDGLTGIVVPPSDPVALREAMQRLEHDPALAEQMGQRARERFVSLFTAQKMAKAYVDLYERVLDQRQLMRAA